MSQPRCALFGCWIDDEGSHLGILNCGNWRCENCGPRKVARVRAMAVAGNASHYVVYTLKPRPGESLNAHHKRGSADINKLHKRLKRRWRLKSLPFMLTVEAHKTGYAHWNVFYRLPNFELKDAIEEWRELNGSFKVSCDRIYNKNGVIRYVTKYITKDMVQYGKSRRWYSSRNWIVEPDRAARKPRLRGKVRTFPIALLGNFLRSLEEAQWKVKRENQWRWQITPPRPGDLPPMWLLGAEPMPFGFENCGWNPVAKFQVPEPRPPPQASGLCHSSSI